MNYWTTITEPQATIIAALLTIVAALVGVFVGSWLFSGKVSDLKTALSDAEKHLEDYRGQVERTVREIGANLELQVQSIQQSLGNIGTSVNDLRDTAVIEDVPAVEDVEEASHAVLRDSWLRIRDTLEGIAANAEDGRTRAKYTRIDRRRYADFIASLARDGALGANEDRYWTALEVWNRNRNGRRQPAADDVRTMREIAAVVAD